jgi:hypothetical protein
VREHPIVSIVAVTLCLRTPDDLFRTPDIDPYSKWYQPYSLHPAIEYVEARVGDGLRIDHLDLTVCLPQGAVAPDTEARMREAIDRYCDARLVAVVEASRRNNWRGWMMLVIALIVVNAILFVAHRLDAAGWETLSVVAEGLSIAAWLLLWHPLDALVFNRWDFRLDRRVLRTIRHRSRLSLQELDLEV